MFDVFHKYVVGDLVILRDDDTRYTHDNLFHKFGNTMHILRRIRNNMDFALDVMVGRLFPRCIPSDLHVINSKGNYEPITEYRAIGQGEIQARSLVDKKWDAEMIMNDFAKLSYCIIKYIEKNIWMNL